MCQLGFASKGLPRIGHWTSCLIWFNVVIGNWPSSTQIKLSLLSKFSVSEVIDALQEGVASPTPNPSSYPWDRRCRSYLHKNCSHNDLLSRKSLNPPTFFLTRSVPSVWNHVNSASSHSQIQLQTLHDYSLPMTSNESIKNTN